MGIGEIAAVKRLILINSADRARVHNRSFRRAQQIGSKVPDDLGSGQGT
jgi:hypothetical protein